MLNVGIIGCGGINERRHLPGLMELIHTVRITVMSDISAEHVALLADPCKSERRRAVYRLP